MSLDELLHPDGLLQAPSPDDPQSAEAPLAAEPGAAGSAAIPRLIEEHGVVGDQGTTALVADDGTVDFLCWPGFDGPTVFAALLDPKRGGAWEIAPTLVGARRRQMYLPDTNVLLTRFSSPDGVGEVIDFMPFPEPGGNPRLVRRVRAVRGKVCFRLCCAPRLDYARGETRATAEEDGSVLFQARGFSAALRLSGSVALQPEAAAAGDAATAQFTLGACGAADFVLLDAAAPRPGMNEVNVLFHTCVDHWRGWAARSTYGGRWQEAVMRSALVLKLLTSRAHGSVMCELCAPVARCGQAG